MLWDPDQQDGRPLTSPALWSAVCAILIWCLGAGLALYLLTLLLRRLLS